MDAIAAVSNNWVMADNDKPLEIPWKEKDDLVFFKEITMGKKIIVSPKTFASVKHLKGRKKYLFYEIRKKPSKDNEYIEAEGFIPIASNPAHYDWLKEDNFIVIGGAFAYKHLLPYCNNFYLTVLHYNVMVEKPLKFPYEEKEISEFFPNKEMVKEITNGEIWHYFK